MFGKKIYVFKKSREIDPEDIFLDSSNLPALDDGRLEGRVERPISRTALISVGVLFVSVVTAFAARALELQVVKGSIYADISRENRIERNVVFAPRGVIYDRTETRLAWNDIASESASTTEVGKGAPPIRRYAPLSGLSHVLGFVRYPKADASGSWWREEYTGVSGAEYVFDGLLQGVNGSVLQETDARGDIVRQDLVEPERAGTDITLSIDAEVQHKLYQLLSTHAAQNRFEGGAAIIMDVRTGELLALTSFPEYNNALFAEGDTAAVRAASTDARTPLLNRAISGLYTPGSIVKPIFAAAALAENLISPEKQILSTGALIVPNPYDPEKPSIFRDWKEHGLVNMREAIAVSSDEYFYTIGGGFGGQAGLGIAKIDDYARRFGLGEFTGTALLGEAEGIIPTPEWKEKVFNGDPWRVGDTYITAIGQYGFQITPIQAVRFVAAIANGGELLVPHLLLGAEKEATPVGIAPEDMKVVQEGMRMAVSSYKADRTARALDMPGISIAGKTGTAQLGNKNQWMNSWVVGYWPYENPHYAFAVVLEKAPANTLSGASPAMRPFFEWLMTEKPEYLE